MKREKEDIDRLDEMLAQHLHRETAPFDFAQWTHRFPEEAACLRSGGARPVRNRKTQLLRIGRYVMSSRYIKLAGVAAVVLVAVSFLFPGRHGIVAESIAWADVQKAMEQVNSARVTGTRNCFFSAAETPTYRLRVEKLFSLSHGYVDRTFNEQGQLIIELTYDLPTGTLTVQFPNWKRYYRAQMPAEYREKARQITPEGFFQWICASGDYRKIGPKEVQGVQAIGFEVSDLPERLASGIGLNKNVVDFFVSVGEMRACVWVDPQARLPLLVEAEGKVNPCLLTGYHAMTLREIDDRWEFDVELDGARFLPAIPKDYQEFTLTPATTP
jgi:hypothetical protein